MKSILTKLAIFILILPMAFAAGCVAAQDDKEPQPLPIVEYPFAPESPAINTEPFMLGDSIKTMSASRAPGEVRSVWISFLELGRVLTGKTEAQFTANVRQMFDNIRDFGLNTVVVQVRPYADAIYKSRYFPWSFLITGEEGRDPGFDPFQIMVDEAKKRGLRIEAWVNPYRIRPADRKDALSADSYAAKWLKEKDEAVINYRGTLSFNPASAKAWELIVAGIMELVENYDIDAVHIDDYFYPTTDKEFDAASYAAYVKSFSGGLLKPWSLEEWRRWNVSALIDKIYANIQGADRKVMFGISPQSSVDNNYNAQYLDIEMIAATPGYCDYICPQIYFGFDNKAQPYAETLKRWSDMVTAPGVKLYVGLAAYKTGAVDTWAGDAGKNEWRQNSDLLKRMTQAARACPNYGGVVLFRYDFMFHPPAEQARVAQREMQNLKALFS